MICSSRLSRTATIEATTPWTPSRRLDTPAPAVRFARGHICQSPNRTSSGTAQLVSMRTRMSTFVPSDQQRFSFMRILRFDLHRLEPADADHSAIPRASPRSDLFLHRQYRLCMSGVEADNRKALGRERMGQPYGRWPALKANPHHARRSFAYQAGNNCRFRRHLSLENSRPVLVEDQTWFPRATRLIQQTSPWLLSFGSTPTSGLPDLRRTAAISPCEMAARSRPFL